MVVVEGITAAHDVLVDMDTMKSYDDMKSLFNKTHEKHTLNLVL